MKVTKRERTLFGITVTVVAIVINYMLVIPLVRGWQDTGARLKSQQRQLAVMEATIQRGPEWGKQYNELRQSLGSRTENFQQITDVQKKIEEIRKSSGVQVTAITPMSPEDKGVYRVLPVRCAVEATTESLVKFLFALQTGAGFVSVEQLQISPRPENPGILRCDVQVRALAAKQGRTGS
jgi:Tfp pilus assembly protein PilO